MDNHDHYGLGKADPPPFATDSPLAAHPKAYVAIQDCCTAVHYGLLRFRKLWTNRDTKSHGIDPDRILIVDREITLSDGIRTFTFTTQRPHIYAAIAAWIDSRPFPLDQLNMIRDDMATSHLAQISTHLKGITK